MEYDGEDIDEELSSRNEGTSAELQWGCYVDETNNDTVEDNAGSKIVASPENNVDEEVSRTVAIIGESGSCIRRDFE